MGLENRDYYAEETRGARRPFRVSTVTGWVILINIAVFVLWQIARSSDSLGEFMSANFTVGAEGVFGELRVHTLLTAVFSHIQPLHILFNMLFFWWFGRELETIYGRKDYLALLLISGGIASLAHVLFQAAMPDEMGPALGASGAVMAVVVAYAFFFPNRRVYFYGIFPMTVKWLAIIYVGTDLLGVMNPSESHVAHAAHLGGALTGLLWYKLDFRLFPDSGTGLGNRIAGFFRNAAARRRARKAESARRDASRTEERVDALLEKIGREGLASLTDEEREFLQGASSRYRS